MCEGGGDGAERDTNTEVMKENQSINLRGGGSFGKKTAKVFCLIFFVGNLLDK